MATDPAHQNTIDKEHIRLTGIGFMVASLYTVWNIIDNFIAYFVNGRDAFKAFTYVSMSNPSNSPQLFYYITIVSIIISILIAVLQFIASKKCKNMKAYPFCLFISIVTGLSLPVGTLIGLFALYVFIRPSVYALFKQAA